MLETLENLLEFYSNTDEFVSAVEYTAGRFKFSTQLIEKDFLCSLVLIFLYLDKSTPLTFKGGTLLAKIYARFYRMSEDLDFSLSISPSSTRKDRSAAIALEKENINKITEALFMLNISIPLTGTNASKQYNASFSYNSKLTGTEGRILVEVSLREEHLITPVYKKALRFPRDDTAGASHKRIGNYWRSWQALRQNVLKETDGKFVSCQNGERLNNVNIHLFTTDFFKCHLSDLSFI